MVSVEKGIVAGLFAAHAIQEQSRARIGLIQQQAATDRAARQLSRLEAENAALKRENDALKREAARVSLELAGVNATLALTDDCNTAGNMMMNSMFAVLGQVDGGDELIRAIGQKALARMREVDRETHTHIEASMRKYKPEKAAKLGI